MAILDKKMDNEDAFEDMDLDTDIIEDNEEVDNNTLSENQYYIYVIIDKDISGITTYFRDYGINVSKVFTNIEAARNTIIMQTEPTKIVVVDTGSGKFASMAARKSLIDLIGIGDENSKITVFYSDTIIKNEVSYAKEVNDKDIKWIKYLSTPQVLATLLQNKGTDEYVIDSEYAEVKELKFTLDSMGIKDTHYKGIDIGPVIIDTPEITYHVASNDENNQDHRYRSIEAYKVEI